MHLREASVLVKKNGGLVRTEIGKNQIPQLAEVLRRKTADAFSHYVRFNVWR